MPWAEAWKGLQRRGLGLQGGGSGARTEGPRPDSKLQGSGVLRTAARNYAAMFWNLRGSMGTPTRGLHIQDAGVLGTRTGNSQELLLELWGPGCLGEDLSDRPGGRRITDGGFGPGFPRAGFPRAEDCRTQGF